MHCRRRRSARSGIGLSKRLQNSEKCGQERRLVAVSRLGEPENSENF